MKALVGLLALCVLAAPAGAVDWHQAELWGGDVRSLAIDGRNPDRILAGTASGQIFRSDDGGTSWAPLGRAVAFPGWVVSDLLIDADSGHVWAALWGLWGNGGTVYYSPDGGAAWEERSQGLPGRQVYRLAMTPGSRRLFAATRTGVFGSDDGGRSWRHLTAAHPQIQKVSSLLVDGSTVLAGTWRRAYKSEDSGESWRGVFNGMVLDSEIFSLQPVPGTDQIWASTCGWVYRSLDRGESWRRFQRGMEERRTQAFRVLSGGRLVAGTVAGLYVSDDDGASWSLRTSPELTIVSITHDPARPRRVLLGTEGSGVWISEDGAETFRRANRGLAGVRVADLIHLAGGELLAAVRHAGPDSGIYSSRDGGRSFVGPQPKLPTVLRLAADGRRPYAATERGLYERSYGEWRLVGELGQDRVDEVAAGGGLAVVRAGDRLYRRVGEGFEGMESMLADPRSVAVVDGQLWLANGKEIGRWPAAAIHPAPFTGGRIGGLTGGLLLAGEGGAWLLRNAGSPWQPLLSRPSSGLPTGDPDYPVLLLPADESPRLLERDRQLLHRLELPVPARDVTAAVVADGRLIVATSGYGVVWTELAGALEVGPDPWARLK